MTTLVAPQRAIQPLLKGARGYRKHLGQYGAGGRSSVNDKTVAVFGATGFLGRFVTNQLGKQNAQARCCCLSSLRPLVVIDTHSALVEKLLHVRCCFRCAIRCSIHPLSTDTCCF